MNPNPILENTLLGSKWFDPDYLFNLAIAFFQYLGFYFTNFTSTGLLSFYHFVLSLFALFFITLISYCSIRIFEIRSKERKHLQHEIEEYAHHQAEREKKKQEGEGVSKNERWVKTLSYLYSQHASDWKLAVIEADSMLEALMDQLGFKGATLGDKLKSSTSDKFHSLSSAWEVHTIRNRIAHEGTSFNLSQHEAKRIIAIYEHIFRDYGYI